MSTALSTLDKVQPQPGSSREEVRFQPGDEEAQGEKVQDDQQSAPKEDQPIGLHVAGIRRAEAAKVLLGPYERGVVYFGVLLSAWAIALAGTVHGTFQGYATGEWHVHSLLSTVGVVSSVCSAVLQPVGAKFADYFGRWEVLCSAVTLYTLGSIVEASAKNLETFCGGAVLRSFGYALAVCIYQVIIADFSSLRTRTFWTIIPTAPAIVNAWVSGDIAQITLRQSTWRWGIGMWTIIVPAASLPLVGMLLLGHFRAVRAGTMPSHRELAHASNTTWTTVFWQLDIIGAFLLAAAFALFFIPFTIAGYAKGSTPAERWRQPQVLAPLILGLLCFPAFGYWQKKAAYPIVPYKLCKDRGIVAAICLAVVLSTARVIQNNFLYAMLLVAFNQTVKSATRITQLYVFTSNLSGVILGLVILYFRRLKLVILCGCAIYLVGYGLLIRYRHGDNVAGVIGAEVVLGLGAGLVTFTTLCSAQARTKHEHVAIITGVYLGSSFFGFGIGGAIAGSMWTQYMPTKLNEYLSPINATLARDVFGDPYRVALRYAVGSPERVAITAAYASVQKLLTVVGICVSALLFACAILLRDTELVDEQSHPEAEEDSERGSVRKQKSWMWR